ncbi:hypothetical protein IWW36_005175, partial [Coemansia brasiliensis]
MVKSGGTLKIESLNSLAKRGLAIVNGVIDQDAAKEAQVQMLNMSKETCLVKAGEDIAQLVLYNVQTPKLKLIEHESVNATTVLQTQVLDQPSDSYKGDRNLEEMAMLLQQHTLSAQDRRRTKQYQLINGILYKKRRCCVGKRKVRARLLAEYHDTTTAMHQGIDRTYE